MQGDAAEYLITRVKVHRLAKKAKAEPGVAGVDGHHKQNPANAALLLRVAEVRAVLPDEMSSETASAEGAPEHGEPDPLVHPKMKN